MTVGSRCAPGGPQPPASEEPILQVVDLEVDFLLEQGPPRPILTGVSFSLYRGETVGLVGESGSGKSTLALALTRLLPSPPTRVRGEVRFAGRDLSSLDPRALREVRGRGIATLPQDPAASLDPLQRVGAQLQEVLIGRGGVTRAAAAAAAERLWQRVGLADLPDQGRAYPHQLSGGLQQRVLLALVLACEPQVLVADEPTSALDATRQQEVLDLLDTWRREQGLGLLLISHDLGLLATRADRLLVLQQGRLVEEGPTAAVLGEPEHPYTRSLVADALDLAGPVAPGPGGSS
ncbi:MAG: ABC transporter ATP-binding protein [Myxococcota bacterium]|jgi:peptide/nickel transport system ATP-binding protein|nr:ABC transporter ATP-binding protein [Myxococcota bacterium]